MYGVPFIKIFGYMPNYKINVVDVIHKCLAKVTLIQKILVFKYESCHMGKFLNMKVFIQESFQI